MNAEDTIRVSGVTLARLKELAAWSGTSVEEALSQAVQQQHDARFWEAVNEGYAALRADETEWAEVEKERREWDATLMDGLDADGGRW
jgi:hypothetical protein